MFGNQQAASIRLATGGFIPPESCLVRAAIETPLRRDKPAGGESGERHCGWLLNVAPAGQARWRREYSAPTVQLDCRASQGRAPANEGLVDLSKLL